MLFGRGITGRTQFRDHGERNEISAGEFKAKCLKLMGNVARTHKPLPINKHGKPVAVMVPMPPEPATPLFGYMAGTATVRGDLIAPVDVEWEAESEA